MQTRNNALMIVLAALMVAGFVIAVTAQPVTATETLIKMERELVPYPGDTVAESWHERSEEGSCTLVELDPEPMTAVTVTFQAEPTDNSGKGPLLMKRVNCND